MANGETMTPVVIWHLLPIEVKTGHLRLLYFKAGDWSLRSQNFASLKEFDLCPRDLVMESGACSGPGLGCSAKGRVNSLRDHDLGWLIQVML